MLHEVARELYLNAHPGLGKDAILLPNMGLTTDYRRKDGMRRVVLRNVNHKLGHVDFDGGGHAFVRIEGVDDEHWFELTREQNAATGMVDRRGIEEKK